MRMEGDADADLHGQLDAGGSEWSRDAGLQSLSRGCRLEQAGPWRQQNRELVVAEPRDRAAGPDDRCEALAHLTEDLVAGLVTECVVDLAEVIDVDEEQCLLIGQLAVQGERQAPPVGQAGHIVCGCLALRLGSCRRRPEREHAACPASQDSTGRQ